MNFLADFSRENKFKNGLTFNDTFACMQATF